MPSKKPTSTIIFLALAGSSIDSAYATAEGAKARVASLTSGSVQEVELVGGNITVVEEKAPKAKAAPKEKKLKKEEDADDEEDEEEEAPKPKKKTKTAAEQRTANAEKGGKATGDDLPDNVLALLESNGHVLDGMNIVVTGVPPTLTRKNAEKLVALYGGKLGKSISKNTSLVVVGNDAGPAKLEKIADLNIITVDEDGFIALIEAGGSGAKRPAADTEEKPKTKKAKK